MVLPNTGRLGLFEVLSNEGGDLTIAHIVRRLQFNNMHRKPLAIRPLLEFALRFAGANDQDRVGTHAAM